MRLKTVLAAALLAIAPTLGLAMGCNDHSNEQASSCAEGFSWDKDAGTCVEQVTS